LTPEARCQKCVSMTRRATLVCPYLAGAWMATLEALTAAAACEAGAALPRVTLPPVGPGRYWPPHHRHAFRTLAFWIELHCMTWRANSARPYPPGAPAVILALCRMALCRSLRLADGGGGGAGAEAGGLLAGVSLRPSTHLIDVKSTNRVHASVRASTLKWLSRAPILVPVFCLNDPPAWRP